MIFHSTNASAQATARVLSHTFAPVRSKFCLQGNACEDARNLCATGSPVCCTQTFPLTLCKNMTPKTLSRETSKARDVTLQARSQTSTQTAAPLGLL